MTNYKYICCNGKIYNDCYKKPNDDRVYRYIDDGYFVREEVVVCKASECIEFDKFEEILEVGDLLIDSDEGAYFAGLVSSAVKPDGQFLINDEDDWIDSVSLFGFNEIYKKIGNTFVKVAHKENNGWVID